MEFSSELINVPFALSQELQSVENKIITAIKALLNDKYSHIRVAPLLSLRPWCGKPIVLDVKTASDFADADAFADDFRAFLLSKDEYTKLLAPNYTLYIKLTLKQPVNNNPINNNTAEATATFTSSEPRYNFNQIILGEAVRREVFDALKIIECKELIYDQWGFDEVDPIPRSILNFYGEPGTGKTMCAHAIANHLDKKILALNYAEIESKYVGEAPKNLQKAFDTAKQDDAVLFFDEADSFLGKRVENVSQGADQALNSLRSQMLILLEEFPGVVLFATNLVTNFDRAFESRILKHIRFELPNQEARAAIIKKMLPSRLPVNQPFTDEEIFEAAALIDGLSGREIKNAILDLLLSKAQLHDDAIRFTIDDIRTALAKKKKEKDNLKAEENRRLKEKIERKVKERIQEEAAQAKAEQGEQSPEPSAESASASSQEQANDSKN